MKKKIDFTKVFIVISFVMFFVALVASSYAFFSYNKEVAVSDLTSGEININISNASSNINLDNVEPTDDTSGKALTSYIDFEVVGTTDDLDIFYNLDIVPKNTNTLDGKYVKLYLTDQDNNEVVAPILYSNLSAATKNNGNTIYSSKFDANSDGTRKTGTHKYRLRVWLDESYEEPENQTFDFDIYLYSYNENLSAGYNKVLKAIEEHATGTCQNITYVEDGITYFSGTNDCINFNYVWYSGKLWRITAIYPDGAMKLVTENNITSIAFNESSPDFYTDSNTTSYMYQWLNEDFYDTLYQPSKFIDTTKRWNATMPANTTISTKPAETNMVTANVGLLNSYEYYNSYRCIGSTACTGSTYSTGYLNIGYYWWLINRYSTSSVWNVIDYGTGSLPTYAYGGRPTIYLKSGLEFTGLGTSTNPYKIKGDKQTGNPNELINTRLSGEYIKLVNNENEQVFRIIGVEDNKTKIIAMDYADNKGTRKFATSSSDALWGSGTTLNTDTWYEYLNRVDNSDISNTGYYDKLVKTYGELFTSSTYYLGTSGYNYKLSVCANTTSGNTKICDKTSGIGTFNIGLPRYGEMFATQQAGGSSNSINMWLINRYSTSNVWRVSSPVIGNGSIPTNANGVRPTLHLKSTVKILSGSGTEQDPYVVGL